LSVSDDDDFGSLDFTLPSSIPEPKPANEPAKPPSAEITLEPLPAVAPAKAAPAPALTDAGSGPKGAARRKLVIPASLSEAAELHAGGDDLAACKALELAIRNAGALGEFVAAAWLCLFELLNLLGRRSAFEQLALAYAKRFEESPPAWVEPESHASEMGMTTGGTAQLALTGALTAAIGDTLKKVMQMAQSSAVVRLEMSKLTDANNDGCTLLRRAMLALKKAGRECLLGSPKVLSDILASKVAMGERRDEAMWLLLLDLYQMIGQQEAFEDTAVNYAVTFEVSPPSWDAKAIPASNESEPETALDLNAGAGSTFALRGQLVGATAAAFAGIDNLAQTPGVIEIDASSLVRIDGASADQLRAKLQAIKQTGREIELKNLSPLTRIFLIVREFSGIAKLVARKT
jgi:anti-anti-sigma regulatory factor